MPKLKTKKTASKRIKITKGGKLIRKKVRTSHLKSKWTTNRRLRKVGGGEVKNIGHKRIFRQLLNKHLKGLK
jgi:ribosomal protein L35